MLVDVATSTLADIKCPNQLVGGETGNRYCHRLTMVFSLFVATQGGEGGKGRVLPGNFYMLLGVCIYRVMDDGSLVLNSVTCWII